MIEYPTLDEWSLKDLFSTFKHVGNRVVVVELRPTLSEISYRESKQTSCLGSLKGCAVSSYKLCKNMPSFPNSFKRIAIDIPTGKPLADVTEKTYKAILQTGLL